jgi:type IV secretory pathway VirD2 relaxase
VVGRVPLARVKDDLIERWLRSTPKAAEPLGGRVYLPNLGKPKAVHRGSARLSQGEGSPYRRRVVVISSHYRMSGAGYSKLHSHLRYIERPGAGEREVTPTLIDGRSDGVEGHRIIQSWRDDRHHFRITLAPADGYRLDMTAYTRAYMVELEAALGTRLEWMAGVHEKADAAHPMNRHVHIVLRGITDDGSDLVMRREFIRHEMRRIAEDLATRYLGQMSQRDLDRHRERQAERERDGERNYHAGYRPRRGEDRDRD